MVEPLIVDTARRHGVSDNDILHAFNVPIHVTHDPDDEEVMIFVGADPSGQTLIEVGVVDSDEGPVIIHAYSPARPKYLPR